MATKHLTHDNGNSIIKSCSNTSEIAYPHALHELNDAQWGQLKTLSGEGGVAEDYAVVNGTPYAFGQVAERYGRVTRREGAQKFTEGYYGVFMAYSAARLWRTGGALTVYGSHAPGDVEYRDDLIAATGKAWTVEIEGRTVNFEVVYANTYEEPLGGVMNLVLNKDGTQFANAEINDGRTLVLDLGGGTFDLFGVNPHGDPDYTMNHSERIGINQVIDDFGKLFRANHKKDLRSLNEIPPEQIRHALTTGIFCGGGRKIPCGEEVEQAVNPLLNRIETAYMRHAGGATPWNNLVLTGGGPMLIEEQLREILDHGNIYMAEESGSMHLANIRGGRKLRYMWAEMGYWYND